MDVRLVEHLRNLNEIIFESTNLEMVPFKEFWKRLESTGGTSNVGYLPAGVTYKDLVKVFGKPNTGFSTDGKVKAEWCGFIDNEPFTIYDYKDSRPVQRIVGEDWHVGGLDHKVALKIASMFDTPSSNVPTEGDLFPSASDDELEQRGFTPSTIVKELTTDLDLGPTSLKKEYNHTWYLYLSPQDGSKLKEIELFLRKTIHVGTVTSTLGKVPIVRFTIEKPR